MPRWNNRGGGPRDGGYQDYRDRPPHGGPQQPSRYPDDDYDGFDDQGWQMQPPYYDTPWGAAPPPQPPRRRPPQQPQWGGPPPRQYNDNRPRNGGRRRPPQREWDSRPPRGPQQYPEQPPRRQVPPEGFNPGTFSLEIGDLVKHRTTGLEMTVIRFGREQVECRIHADMSPNWFYESELVFVKHQYDTDDNSQTSGDSDPQ